MNRNTVIEGRRPRSGWRALALPVLATVVLALAACGPSGSADGDKPAKGALLDGTTAHDGLFTLYTDEAANRVLMALPAPDPKSGTSARVLHLSYLRTSLGSNPVGLDRGRGGRNDLVRFDVVGDRVLLIAENTRFTATSTDAAERRATDESFARSVIWTTEVLEMLEDGRVVIDLAGFLTRDAQNIAVRLDQSGQGRFTLDAGRSLPLARESLAFPDNVEFDAVLTFASDRPGPEVRATTPVPQAVTLTVHHSFVRLPDDGYRPRHADPRLGAIALPIADYAAPLDAPIQHRFALRHRLEKTDPAAASSPVKKPIVFYVDRGAPEPVRSALIDGAGWWAEAFEAAGFEDGYRVELLPEDAHPLDARYNIIQWVHRQTRGWSYGNPIIDPRTGEIVKAVITLGSLRVRQDRRIFEALLDAERTGSGAADDPIELSLARVRQLAAHEVGHGLGFVHNMAASTYDGRASVMDYPAPLVRLTDAGEIDVSRAYAVGMGSWDILNVRHLYGAFGTPAEETAALAAMVEEAQRDHVFVSDPHSRPVSGAHPRGSVWDNGEDAVDELAETLDVRAAALADFGLANLPDGAPVSDLNEILVPLYLYHRYQVAAAAKVLGGIDFQYAVKGDGREGVRPVAAADQYRALDVLLRTIDPEMLALPGGLIDLLQPHNQGWSDGRYSREELRSDGFPAFDTAQAATVAAGLTFDALLSPERLTRLDQFNGTDARLPSVDTVLIRTTERVFTPAPERRLRVLQNAVARRYVAGLIRAAQNTPPAVSARIEGHLRELAPRSDDPVATLSPLDAALVAQIHRFLDRPAEATAVSPPAPRTPPGSPIGAQTRLDAGYCDTCWFCEPAGPSF